MFNSQNLDLVSRVHFSKGIDTGFLDKEKVCKLSVPGLVIDIVLIVLLAVREVAKRIQIPSPTKLPATSHLLV